MERKSWSRVELCELVRGRAVFVRDQTAADVPVPAWLGAAAETVWVQDAGTSIEATHPDDRMQVVDSFLASLEHPGVPCVARVREHIGDAWFHVELTWLNQLTNEEIKGLIGARRIVGHAGGEVPVAGDTGDSEATGWVLLELDQIGTIGSARGEVQRTLGWDAHELVGRSLASLIPPDSVAESITSWMSMWADPTATRVNRRRYRRADGTEVWIESSYLHDGDGGIICVLIDISERVARERELSELTEQLSLLADAVPTALVRCDPTGRVLFHNARWTELIGRGGGARLHDIVFHRAALDSALAAVATGPTRDHQVHELAGADGSSTWQITLQPVGDPGPDRVIVASVADATDTVQLRKVARHDGLTGVLNRSAIEEQLNLALADDAEGTLVAFLDLDNFKTVNDTYGHDAGDAVLRAVAGRLRSAIRPGDHVGRYGGDEFIVVYRHIEPGTETDLLGRLAGALVDPVSVPGGLWRPAASIGHGRAVPGDDLAAVLRRADLAMFDVKRARSARS